MNDLNKMMDAIYMWSVNEKGQCVPPRVAWPSYVQERIDWVNREMKASPLSFIGALQEIFAYDEANDKRKWEWGASQDWLPVSDEFDRWRNSPSSNVKEMAIAVDLLYGTSAPIDVEHDAR